MGQTYPKNDIRKRIHFTNVTKMANINDLVQLNVLNAIEEAELLANRPLRRVHAFIDPFEYYSSNQFLKIYRLTKPLAAEPIDLLEPHMVHPVRLSGLLVDRMVRFRHLTDKNVWP